MTEQNLKFATPIHPYDLYDLVAKLDCKTVGEVEEAVYAGLPCAYTVKRDVVKVGDKLYISTTTAPFKSRTFDAGHSAAEWR